jgi:diguanylate cyclase (GGDEF)-like protein
VNLGSGPSGDPAPGGPSALEGGRLAGLARLARALVPARTVVQVAQVAAHEARFAFEARVASVGRFEVERGALRVLAIAGDLAPTEQARPSDDVRPLAAHPMLADLAASGATWVALLADPGLSEAARRDLHSDGSHSALSVPIVHEGAVWGALLVRRGAGGRAFEPVDLDFAAAFAGLVSAGLGQVEHVARVRRLAYSDPLTGLGNRRLIEERLERLLGGPGQGPVSVLMADVNGLKAANDAFTHAQGDAALRAVATALSRAAGRHPGALAGRIGGDEFCVVVEGGADEALAVAEDFLALAADVPYVRGVAVGVASSALADGPVSRERLLSWADEAQYAAKAAGSTQPIMAGRDAVSRPERRRWRGRPGSDLLPRVLTDLAEHAGIGPAERLAHLARALADEVGADAWVVAHVADGAATPVVASESAPSEESMRMALPWPADAAWVRRAATTGVELLAGDVDTPLADVRGYLRVGLVQAGDWVVELATNADTTLLGVLPTLRSLAAVAVVG